MFFFVVKLSMNFLWVKYPDIIDNLVYIIILTRITVYLLIHLITIFRHV